MIGNDEKRLLVALKKAGHDCERIAKLIDTAKRRRCQRDPKWRSRLTPVERSIWQFINLVRRICKLEASIGRTEDRLGLQRSKPTQAWDVRFRRIHARRAALTSS